MTPGRVALAATAGVLALLALSQLLLPGIAERRLRDRLERNGTVERVQVDAVPALKLLGGRADSVEIRMARSRSGAGRFADLVASSHATDELDARVEEVQVVLLRLRDLRLRKRGARLEGEAAVDDAQLRAALPAGFDVRPVASGGGALVLEGRARLLGAAFSGRAVVAARGGRVVLTPDVPFGGVLALTLFADPRIEVTGVGAGTRPGGFTLTAQGRLLDDG